MLVGVEVLVVVEMLVGIEMHSLSTFYYIGNAIALLNACR
jgi:hypothetical protein